MNIIVKKYGGTSLATVEHIRRIAKNIAAEKKDGKSLIVVLSAMAGETDRLLQLSAEASAGKLAEREQDVLISAGEQVSVALMCMALSAIGCPAKSFLGWQIPIITNATHTRARILRIETEAIKKALDNDMVVVIAGFQGINIEGISDNSNCIAAGNARGGITTLGRGGSDTTAVAIAAAMEADVCEIFTDVDGVYTADPAICKEARHLSKITYEEMLEMSGLGAKVLQIRSVELARKYQLPLLVKSSFGGERFTWITKEENQMEDAIISGITLDRNEAKISVMGVPDKPGVAYRIISPLADAAINVDMIIQNVGRDKTTDLTFTVPLNNVRQARDLVEQVVKSLDGSRVDTSENIAKVSLVGIGMRNHPGVAAKMFKALGEENINIQMISTSEIRISCVIDAKYGELAVRVLHNYFELAHHGDGSPDAFCSDKSREQFS